MPNSPFKPEVGARSQADGNRDQPADGGRKGCLTGSGGGRGPLVKQPRIGDATSVASALLSPPPGGPEDQADLQGEGFARPPGLPEDEAEELARSAGGASAKAVFLPGGFLQTVPQFPGVQQPADGGDGKTTGNKDGKEEGTLGDVLSVIQDLRFDENTRCSVFEISLFEFRTQLENLRAKMILR